MQCQLGKAQEEVQSDGEASRAAYLSGSQPLCEISCGSPSPRANPLEGRRIGKDYSPVVPLPRVLSLDNKERTPAFLRTQDAAKQEVRLVVINFDLFFHSQFSAVQYECSVITKIEYMLPCHPGDLRLSEMINA
jgi:hypothetical protein